MANIVEGRQWLEQRLGFLEETLRTDPSPAVRAELEAEISRLEAELAETRRRRRRWLLWGGQPPVS